MVFFMNNDSLALPDESKTSWSTMASGTGVSEQISRKEERLYSEAQTRPEQAQLDWVARKPARRLI